MRTAASTASPTTSSRAAVAAGTVRRSTCHLEDGQMPARRGVVEPADVSRVDVGGDLVAVGELPRRPDVIGVAVREDEGLRDETLGPHEVDDLGRGPYPGVDDQGLPSAGA